MEKPYLVEFLSSVELKGNKNFIQTESPLELEELKEKLEDLLLEKSKQGYELFQIHGLKNSTGEKNSGIRMTKPQGELMVLVFKKMKWLK